MKDRQGRYMGELGGRKSMDGYVAIIFSSQNMKYKNKQLVMYKIMFIPQVYEESITVKSFPQSFLFFSCFQIINSNMEKALAFRNF